MSRENAQIKRNIEIETKKKKELLKELDVLHEHISKQKKRDDSNRIDQLKKEILDGK